MNSFTKTLFFGTVAVELCVCGFYGFTVYRKKQIEKNVLGAISINPIKKENLIFSPDAELKYFYEPKPNTKQNENPDWLSYTATYSINGDSLNERYEYTIEKPKNSFRIVTIGDSWTFGLYVDTINNWPEKLEDKLNTSIHCKNIDNVEVINLGVHGYDLLYVNNRFKKKRNKI